MFLISVELPYLRSYVDMNLYRKDYHDKKPKEQVLEDSFTCVSKLWSLLSVEMLVKILDILKYSIGSLYIDGVMAFFSMNL